jgi:transcription elongation GreA/GreB family factor
MSRAFVREDDAQGPEPPRRSHGDQPNYVTPRGMVALRARHAALAAERERAQGSGAFDAAETLARLERDLAWLREGIESAIVIGADAAPADRVGFGATVTVRDENGQPATYTLVGEDEADPKRGLMNWASPLGRALLGAAVGEVVTWRRPNGDVELEVVSFDYRALQG